jgi:hypothetical protein
MSSLDSDRKGCAEIRSRLEVMSSAKLLSLPSKDPTWVHDRARHELRNGAECSVEPNGDAE